MLIKKAARASYLFIFLSLLPLLNALNNEHLCNFFKKYLVDESLQRQCDKLFRDPALRKAFLKRDKKALERFGFFLYRTWKRGDSIVAEHPSIPGWIFKGEKRSIYGGRNIARLKYAEYMRQTIQSCNYKFLDVVEEYLYHLPGKKRKLNGNNYLIISKKIDPLFIEAGHIPSLLSHQIVLFIKKTGYWDAHRENILFVSNKEGALRAVFIDTEPFPSYRTWLWGAVRFVIGRIGAQRFKRSLLHASSNSFLLAS